MSTRAAFALPILLLFACRAEQDSNAFPIAGRDVAPIVDDSFSTEDVRDRTGEAEEVMRLADIRSGMSVADVGAGEGYYTVRLSRRTSYVRRGTAWLKGFSGNNWTMSQCDLALRPIQCFRSNPSIASCWFTCTMR